MGSSYEWESNPQQMDSHCRKRLSPGGHHVGSNSSAGSSQLKKEHSNNYLPFYQHFVFSVKYSLLDHNIPEAQPHSEDNEDTSASITSC